MQQQPDAHVVDPPGLISTTDTASQVELFTVLNVSIYLTSFHRYLLVPIMALINYYVNNFYK